MLHEAKCRGVDTCEPDNAVPPIRLELKRRLCTLGVRAAHDERPPRRRGQLEPARQESTAGPPTHRGEELGDAEPKRRVKPPADVADDNGGTAEPATGHK